MLPTAIEVLGAPLLIALSTFAGRRWGARAGGVVSAFPAIVGPVLLITTLEHGPRFAAQTANGVLLGLLSLSGFGLAYARAAVRTGWQLSLTAGLGCAAVCALTVVAAASGVGSPIGVIVALASLTIAYLMLPERGQAAPVAPPASLPLTEIALRMAACAALVTLLAAAASRLGPLAGGVLAALPVLASVLAVCTHRREGSGAARALVRGMLAGMVGFVAFCEIVAALVVSVGVAPAFLIAAITALAIQAISAGSARSTPHHGAAGASS